MLCFLKSSISGRMKLNTFLKETGIILTEDGAKEIENLDEEEIKELKQKILREKPIFVDKKFILSVKKPKISFYELKLKEMEMDMRKFVEIMNKYFDTLSERIKRKMNPLRMVSISSLNENEYIGIIGIIKDIKEKENGVILEIEDKTGSVIVFINNEMIKKENINFLVNDIVGIEGLYKSGKVIGEKVFFPVLENDKDVKFEKETVIYARNDIDSIRIAINGKLWTVKNPAIFRIDDIEVLVFLNEKNLNPKMILRRSNLLPGRINLSMLLYSAPHIVITTHTPSLREDCRNIKIFGLDKKEEIRIKLSTLEEIVG